MSKSRIIDIALQAGVSTATVDRVLNDRPGVRKQTRNRVIEAIRQLQANESRPTVIPSVDQNLCIGAVVADGAGFANDVLTRELQNSAHALGVTLITEHPHRHNAAALANAIQSCLGRGAKGILIQALDHPLVRQAVDQASAACVPVVSLLTSLPGSGSLGYVGLDNRAAGRTAGLLMGLMAQKLSLIHI